MANRTDVLGSLSILIQPVAMGSGRNTQLFVEGQSTAVTWEPESGRKALLNSVVTHRRHTVNVLKPIRTSCALK